MPAIKLPLLKRDAKCNYHVWTNSYVPDRSRKGGYALDDLIKHISNSLVHSLNEIEKETNFSLLIDLPEKEIREEAVLLQQELNSIKALLEKL